FTMTSLPEDPDISFVVKIYDTSEYPEHSGLTEAVGKMAPGDKVFATEPFGDLRDQGPGVLIAGGAGITPFIPILRARQNMKALDGFILIYANKTESDIILRRHFEEMRGLNTVFITNEERAEGLPFGMVDEEFIRQATGFDHRFYVCGPPPMMEDVIDTLRDNGVATPDLVLEEGWLD
ncbi:MAG: flavodoxin reductase, partial [Pseudomonadota bacterium]